MTFPKSELFQPNESNDATANARDYMVGLDGFVAFAMSELRGAIVFSVMRNMCMFNTDKLCTMCTVCCENGKTWNGTQNDNSYANSCENKLRDAFQKRLERVG